MNKIIICHLTLEETQFETEKRPKQLNKWKISPL